MPAANWHTYQILTKRADRMHVVKRKTALRGRRPHLVGRERGESQARPAAHRELRGANPAIAFLSVEPLLEDLGRVAREEFVG